MAWDLDVKMWPCQMTMDLMGLSLDIMGAIALRAVLDETRRSDIAPELIGVQPRDQRLVDRVVESEQTVQA